MLAASACGGVEELGQTQVAGEPAPLARLARLHVIIQPPGDFAGDEPALEITGVFAQYRGFDEPAARARLDLRPLATSRLRPGMCAPSEQIAAEGEPGTKDSLGSRELSLLDVGNITAQIGRATVDVPLALLPDLVPTIAGVTYVLLADVLPPDAWPQGEPSPSDLTLRVDGDGDDLPGFTLRPTVPEALVLSAERDDVARELRLAWSPDGRGEPVTFRFLGQIGGEAVGDEVTCVADDHGSLRVELDRLQGLGVDTSRGTALRIAAVRATRALFDVGEFSGSEAIVEVRSALVLGP